MIFYSTFTVTFKGNTFLEIIYILVLNLWPMYKIVLTPSEFQHKLWSKWKLTWKTKYYFNFTNSLILTIGHFYTKQLYNSLYLFKKKSTLYSVCWDVLKLQDYYNCTFTVAFIEINVSPSNKYQNFALFHCTVMHLYCIAFKKKLIIANSNLNTASDSPL